MQRQAKRRGRLHSRIKIFVNGIRKSDILNFASSHGLTRSSPKARLEHARARVFTDNGPCALLKCDAGMCYAAQKSVWSCCALRFVRVSLAIALQCFSNISTKGRRLVFSQS